MTEKRPPVLHLSEGFRHFNASFCGLGGKVMGYPNRPLVGVVHRPETLGNCRKSAAHDIHSVRFAKKTTAKETLIPEKIQN